MLNYWRTLIRKPLTARGQGRPPACLATINGILDRTREPIVLNARNVAVQVREESIVSKRVAGFTYEYVLRAILSLIQTERYLRAVFQETEKKAGSSLTR